MKKIISTLFLAIVALLLNISSSSAQVVKDKPKEPNLFNEKREAKPGPGYIWIDGEWKYNKKKELYEHQSGKWEKEKDGHAWVNGHWEREAGGYKWEPGHWKKKM
jgi:hypothetical protein